VRSIAEEVVVLRNGRVEESGPATRLFRRPSTEYTASLLENVPRLRPAPILVAVDDLGSVEESGRE
jgi:ABC-type glutathione transport system ATPase component